MSSSNIYTIAEIGNNHQGDLEHAKRLINGANPNMVEGVVLARSLPQSSKEKELKFLIDNAKSAMKNKEVTVITITTH